MSIIAWIVLGLIAGFIASKLVNKTGKISGLGIVGAVVGGFVFNQLGAAGITGLNLYSMIGAVLVLVIYHAVTGRRAVV